MATETRRMPNGVPGVLLAGGIEVQYEEVIRIYGLSVCDGCSYIENALSDDARSAQNVVDRAFFVVRLVGACCALSSPTQGTHFLGGGLLFALSVHFI